MCGVAASLSLRPVRFAAPGILRPQEVRHMLDQSPPKRNTEDLDPAAYPENGPAHSQEAMDQGQFEFISFVADVLRLGMLLFTVTLWINVRAAGQEEGAKWR